MHFRRLFRDTLIYGSGRVMLQLIAVVLTPVWTRIFVPSDYGVLETIASLTTVLALSASLGLESASQRSYFDYQETQADKRRVVLSTTLWTLVLTSGILALVGILLRAPISRAFFGTDAYATMLGLAALTVPLAVLTNFCQEVMRVRHQPVRYSLLSVVSGVAAIAFALFFVLARDKGLEGYYLGVVVGSAIGLALAYVIVRDVIRPRVNLRELRIMLAYGLPLVPVAASTWVLQLADRFFLLHFGTLRELGLYGVGYRLANFLLLFTTAVGLAWAPLMLELHASDPAAERVTRSRTLNYVTFILCFGAIFLSVYAREIFRTITSPAFADAYQVAGLLSGSVVFIGMNVITISAMAITRRTGYLARYTLYAAGLNTVLNFILIPTWTMIGAALATFVTYGFLAALYYWRAEALDPAPFEKRRLLVILVVAAAIIAVGTFINIEPMWLSILVKVPLVVAFPVLLMVLRAFDWSTLTSVPRFALAAMRSEKAAA
jgi:O-antigen/teichoic acid export membrane protein